MTSRDSNWQGKTALITGAGSGIGRALACALGAAGAQLLLVGRDRAKLQAAAAVEHAPSPPTCHACDLADEAQLEALVAKVAGSVPRLDVLAHSAGNFSLGGLADLSVQELDRLYRTHLRAPYRLTQALLPQLRAAQGEVVFINSTAALQASPTWAAYAAVKAGLKMLADGMRPELDAQGIRVLSVYPGRTATPMQERVFHLEGRDYKPEELLQPDDLAARIVNLLELTRTAEATDLIVKPMKKVVR